MDKKITIQIEISKIEYKSLQKIYAHDHNEKDIDLYLKEDLIYACEDFIHDKLSYYELETSFKRS